MVVLDILHAVPRHKHILYMCYRGKQYVPGGFIIGPFQALQLLIKENFSLTMYIWLIHYESIHRWKNCYHFQKTFISNVWAATSEMPVCALKDCSLNYPRWLSTVKGFPNAVIMAHSNSINQQARAITASMDFDYWLYALMTSILSPAHYITQLEGRNPPLLLLPFSPAGANISCRPWTFVI